MTTTGDGSRYDFSQDMERILENESNTFLAQSVRDMLAKSPESVHTAAAAVGLLLSAHDSCPEELYIAAAEWVGSLSPEQLVQWREELEDDHIYLQEQRALRLPPSLERKASVSTEKANFSRKMFASFDIADRIEELCPTVSQVGCVLAFIKVEVVFRRPANFYFDN